MKIYKLEIMVKRMKKSILFNDNISPACEYCELGSDSSEYGMILCKKEGIVSPYFRCKKFRYSPVRRNPKRLPKIEEHEPSDFSI